MKKLIAMLLINLMLSKTGLAQVYTCNDAPFSPYAFKSYQYSRNYDYWVRIFPLGYNYDLYIGDAHEVYEDDVKNVQQKQQDLLKIFKATTATLSFKQLGRSGKTMRININLSNDGLSSITVLKKSYINVDLEASLMKCDNIDLTGTAKNYTLEESIERLHEIDFKSFYTCTLALKPIAEDNFIEAHNKYYSSYKTQEDKNYYLNIFHSGEVSLTPNNGSFNHWVFRPTLGLKPDFIGQQQAEQGAQEFVRLLKDHADVIANAYLDQLSEAEIRSATQSSLNSRKDKILMALTKISLNYTSLPVLNKLALSYYISEGYAYVAQIEAQAKVLRRSDRLNINFDQYLQ